MTNGDEMRQMSNEALAEIIARKMACEMCNFISDTNCNVCNCEKGIKSYLDMEVEE